MQHTVIAFFDTHPQAEAARDALVTAGIAERDVVLKVRCEPTYASDATSASSYAPAADEGLLASIERFFESLFISAPHDREAVRYAEAVRRGAVMVCVDAATDALAQLTRATLEAMGPLDIEERAATWHAPVDDATRSHSPLEELGLRPSVSVASERHRTVHVYPHDANPIETVADDQAVDVAAAERAAATEAAATAVAAGSAPGMGAVFTAGRGTAQPVREPAPASPAHVPDEYLENEEAHRGDEPDKPDEPNSTPR